MRTYAAGARRVDFVSHGAADSGCSANQHGTRQHHSCLIRQTEGPGAPALNRSDGCSVLAITGRPSRDRARAQRYAQIHEWTDIPTHPCPFSSARAPELMCSGTTRCPSVSSDMPRRVTQSGAFSASRTSTSRKEFPKLARPPHTFGRRGTTLECRWCDSAQGGPECNVVFHHL